MPASPTITDVLIVGGGHAGLSAALSLYRALHTCVVFDSHQARQSDSLKVHLTPTWENRDHADLRERSRTELKSSGLVEFVDHAAISVEKTSAGLFSIADDKKQIWLGRAILLAVGTKDVYPNITGYQELWTERIFPCMFQFGFELRGSHSAGLLAIDSFAKAGPALKIADDAHKFTDYMTIYTNSNPALALEISQGKEVDEVKVDDRKIKKLSQDVERQTVIIDFEDGSQAKQTFLVHRPLTKLDCPLAEQLGLELSPMGDIKVFPPFNQTSVPLIYAAGDCASPMKIIPNAVAMGAYAGAGLARDLPKRVTGRLRGHA